MKQKVTRATRAKKSKRPKRTRASDAATHAILFKFSSTNNRDFALKKEIDGGDRDVVYWAMRKPAYYKWNPTSKNWRRERGRKKVYKVGDRVAFVFCDSAQQTEALGVAIDFQQSIAPFDDDVTATIRMAAALQRSFETSDQGTLESFFLAWEFKFVNDLVPAGSGEAPVEGFAFENAGRYDYTVSLLSLPRVQAIGQLPARRYWHDPEMDIGN